MVDASRIYLWAWDARPFPAFPLRSDLWSDGANWDRGHWLNGRLANPDLGDLIRAILSDHGQPAADVGGVEGMVHGYVIDEPTSARAATEPLADLFDIAVREEGDTLVFAQASSSSSVAIEIVEVVEEEGGATVETVRSPDHELPAEAVLTFRDPLSEYQSASVRTSRMGAAGSRQQSLSFPGVLERGQGGALLDNWMRRLWYERETVAFSVAQPRSDIVPGAIVTLPGSGSPSEFLVTGIEDGLARKVSARQITRTPPSPWIGSRPSGVAPAMPVSGAPHAVFLDLPMGTGEGEPKDHFRVAAWQKPWRSQSVSVSPESTGFALRASIGQAATLGQLAEALEPGFEGRIDHARPVMVELFDAEVESVSLAQLLNGGNAAAVRSGTDVWEILQFATAQEVAPRIWRLSGLLRGQLGTGDAMAAGAPAGADFVLLDRAVVPAGLLASETGLLLNWRVEPSASDFSGENHVQSIETGGLRCLLPFSPVHLKARWMEGGLQLAWTRRGRVDADGWDAADIPLGEEREEYQVQIAAAEGEVVRTQTVAVSSWLYPAADIAADFVTPPAAIDVVVRQFSAACGWGLPAKRRLTLS